MCRMCLVVSNKNQKYLEMLQKKVWADGNPDGIGIYYNDRSRFSDKNLKLSDKLGFTIRYNKTQWLEPIEREYNRYLAHFRNATTGKGTHPFRCTCKRENYWFFAHNGVIRGWPAIKRDLESKGHKFNGDIDSEVIVHLFENTNPRESLLSRAKDLMKAFYSYEGTSSSMANFLFYNAFTDQWLAISDGSLDLLQSGETVIVCSDTRWLPKNAKYKHLSSGTVAWGKGLYVNVKENAIESPTITRTVSYLNSENPNQVRVINGYGYDVYWDDDGPVTVPRKTERHCDKCHCEDEETCQRFNPCSCCCPIKKEEPKEEKVKENIPKKEGEAEASLLAKEEKAREKLGRALDFFEKEAYKLEECEDAIDLNREFEGFFDMDSDQEKLTFLERIIAKVENILRLQAQRKLTGSTSTKESLVGQTVLAPSVALENESSELKGEPTEISKVDIGSIGEPAKPEGSISASSNNEQATSEPVSDTILDDEFLIDTRAFLTENCVCGKDRKCIYHEYYGDKSWNDSDLNFLEYRCSHESVASEERRKKLEDESIGKKLAELSPLLKKGFTREDLTLAVLNNVEVKGFGRSNRKKLRRKIQELKGEPKKTESTAITVYTHKAEPEPEPFCMVTQITKEINGPSLEVKLTKSNPELKESEIIGGLALDYEEVKVEEVKAEIKMADISEDGVTVKGESEGRETAEIKDALDFATLGKSCLCVPERGIFCFDHRKQINEITRKMEEARERKAVVQSIVDLDKTIEQRPQRIRGRDYDVAYEVRDMREMDIYG